jgi:6-phosphogluconolactonase
VTEVVRTVHWADPADDEAVVRRLAEVLGRPGYHSIAVPGGRTPRPILERLAGRWNPGWQAEVMLTDDRQVPDDHPASNFAMLSQTLGDTRVRLVRLEAGRPAGPFDLVWVGMGADGHIASLFPGGDVDAGAPPMVIAATPDPLPPEAPYPRLTLTLSALASTKDLIVVARGHDKRPLLEAAQAGEGDLPVTRLFAAARCPVTIYWSAK